MNGVLCGLLFRRPLREWPGLSLVAVAMQVLVIYLVRGDLARGATVIGALGGLTQALLAAAMLRRLTAGESPLENARGLAWFVALAVCLIPLLVSPVSAAAFAMGLRLPFAEAWRPLFVGNSLSMLLFAPPLMSDWRVRGRIGPWCAGNWEIAIAQFCIASAAIVAFAVPAELLRFVALPYTMFPLLAWSALRCGPGWTSVGIVVVSTIAAWCTARGLGAFAPPGLAPGERVLALQSYLALLALTAILLSALSEQRRRTVERLIVDTGVRDGFMDGSNAVLTLRDLQGRNVLVNRQYEVLRRRPRAELLGRSPQELMSPEEAAMGDAHDRRVVERGEPLSFDEVYDFDGTKRTFAVTRFPVRDAYGAVAYVGVIARDVTVERRLTESLRGAQRIEMIGTLAAGLAHDLNNLLMTMMLNAGMLRDSGTLAADDAQSLTDVIDAGTAASRLTARLLSFGRSQTPEPVALDVDTAVREIEPMLRVLARGMIDLRLELDAAGAIVKANPLMLEQVTLNLVSNARDALGDEGTVIIATAIVPASAVARDPDTLSTAARWVQLSVTDTGAGMAEATLASLFEPFFTTKGDRGTGLGLYTTSLLVRDAGGTIRATSTASAGSRFIVAPPLLG